MNGSTLKVCLLAAALFSLSAAPTLAQQVKGDSEVGLSGSLTLIPITTNEPVYNTKGVETGTQSETTVSTTASVSVDYGYYFTRHDLFGIDDAISISGTSGTGSSGLTTQNTFTGRYRHLFGGDSAKVYPFLGAGGGFFMQSIPMSNSSDTGYTNQTTTDGLFSFEGGLKFYMNQKTAFEVSYQYQEYQETTPASSGVAASSSWQSIDAVNFGFTYVFGGPRSKH